MSEEPPADMNGVVRPVIGMSAEMPAVTTNTWIAIVGLLAYLLLRASGLV